MTHRSCHDYIGTHVGCGGFVVVEMFTKEDGEMFTPHTLRCTLCPAKTGDTGFHVSVYQSVIETIRRRRMSGGD